VREVAAFFTANEADLVLANQVPDALLALRARLTRAEPAVVLRRGLDRPFRGAAWRKRRLAGLAAILANSEATARTVKASLRFFPEEKIYVVYNPVPIPEEARHVPLEAYPKKKIVVHVGRLVRQKDQTLLLRAFRLVVEKEPEALLLLIGDGPLKRKLLALAKKLKISEKVRFLGEVPQEEIPRFYRAAFLAVYTSLYEGFCYGAAEAMAFGVPVVAPDVSSFPEIVQHEKTGLLVGERSPGTFARAILALLANGEKRQAMGEEARRAAAGKLSPARIYERLEAVLSSLVG